MLQRLSRHDFEYSLIVVDILLLFELVNIFACFIIDKTATIICIVFVLNIFNHSELTFRVQLLMMMVF